MQSLHVFRFAAFAASGFAYLLSFYIPAWVSYENGPIEIAQNTVLLAGGIQALYFTANSQSQWRYLWLSVAPVWFVCLGRELSWGAVFFRPLTISVSGPFYTSDVLAYKSLVAPTVGLLLMASLAMFMRFRLWEICAILFKSKRLPVLEVFMAVLAVLLMTAAENHMGMSLKGYLGDGQIFEETIELAAYLFLFSAQIRVHSVEHLLFVERRFS
jgi:hypothetical protein